MADIEEREKDRLKDQPEKTISRHIETKLKILKIKREY